MTSTDNDTADPPGEGAASPPPRAVDLGHVLVYSPGPTGGSNVWACPCGRTAIEKDGIVWGSAAREQCPLTRADR